MEASLDIYDGENLLYVKHNAVLEMFPKQSYACKIWHVPVEKNI